MTNSSNPDDVFPMMPRAQVRANPFQEESQHQALRAAALRVAIKRFEKNTLKYKPQEQINYAKCCVKFCIEFPNPNVAMMLLDHADGDFALAQLRYEFIYGIQDES